MGREEVKTMKFKTDLKYKIRRRLFIVVVSTIIGFTTFGITYLLSDKGIISTMTSEWLGAVFTILLGWYQLDELKRIERK